MKKLFERILLIELSPLLLIAVSALVGNIWGLSIFDQSFISGENPFWQFPHGTIRGSRFDMAQVLVAYLYYVQAPWDIPIFHVSALGSPNGVNVVMMDVVPLVALYGKFIHSLSGQAMNFYGIFLLLCYELPGVMMTWVLITAGIRNVLAVIIGTIFANAMPILLFRWGHLALEAQFLLIGTIALYLFTLQRPANLRTVYAWIGWLTFTYLININMFVMIGIVWICSLLQRWLNKQITLRWMFCDAALAYAVLLSVIILGGQFGGKDTLPFGEYGTYSMNLLSPFVPQMSGLFPGMGGILDPTGNQFEGFNYLGAGVILASILVLPLELRWLARNLRRHIVLFVAFVLMTMFAISNRVYAGNWHLFSLPMPIYIEAPLGILRSSGRFFWLVAYTQVALVIILAFRSRRPMLAVCLAIAAVLQLIDVQPLRQQIIASISDGPSTTGIDRTQLRHLISEASLVEVVPSFQCSESENLDETERLFRTNMELMIAAARDNVPINSVYLSRQSYGLTVSEILRSPSHAREMKRQHREQYCRQEVNQVITGGQQGEAFFLLTDEQEISPDVACTSFSWGRYCVR